MPHREFNINEVADYLHVSKKSVKDLVNQGEIPFERKGGRLVFRRKDLDSWASQRILGLSEDKLTDYHKATSIKSHDLSTTHNIMPELIRKEYIAPDMSSKTKSSIIRDMVALADHTGLLNDPEGLRTSIEEREQMCSTALDGGMAVLHPHTQDPYMSEDSFVIMGKTVQPIPFGSPDGRTTDIFFLLCSQSDRIHLHVLARICMMCHHTDLLLNLREAGDAESMHKAIIAAEDEVIDSL